MILAIIRAIIRAVLVLFAHRLAFGFRLTLAAARTGAKIALAELHPITCCAQDCSLKCSVSDINDDMTSSHVSGILGEGGLARCLDFRNWISLRNRSISSQRTVSIFLAESAEKNRSPSSSQPISLRRRARIDISIHLSPAMSIRKTTHSATCTQVVPMRCYLVKMRD